MISMFSRMAPCGALLIVSVLSGLVPNPLAAQTVMEKAARDEIAVVSKSDPNMAAAMGKARATLADFLKLAAAPKPGTEGFGVKIAVREGDDVEYFWIAPFTVKAGQFSGEINNTPRSVRSVKMGQTISFAQSDIVDWIYIENGMMKGNYTACALLKSAPKQEAEEFRRHFGLKCDV